MMSIIGIWNFFIGMYKSSIPKTNKFQIPVIPRIIGIWSFLKRLV